MPGAKGRSGRKKKSLERAHTELSIAESGEDAARYIKEVMQRKVEPKALLLDNAWRIVYQLSGKPAQRIYQDIESKAVTRIEVSIKRADIDNAKDTA